MAAMHHGLDGGASHRSAHSNLEAFGGGLCGGEMTMADISQQTYMLSGQLSQEEFRLAMGGDRLKEPLRVEGALRVGSASALAGQPMHVQRSPRMGRGAAVAAADLERHQQQRSAQMMQLLQAAASSQGMTGDASADNMQKVLAEVFRQSAGNSEAVMAGFTAAQGGAGGLAAQDAGGLGAQARLGMWGGFGWGPHAASEEPLTGGQRVEELNCYIRQQAQEYIEGQAEWSRQIAEVRSEASRELERVKRDKGEVERQARQELLRLQQRLREAGLDDRGSVTSTEVDSSPRPSAGSWSTVNMEDFQQLHRKWTAAEDRARELEQYIKDQSAKQMQSQADPQAQEKDEEIRRLRQALAASASELRTANAELQALRARHQQKVLFWEHGAQRLAAAADAFLGQGLWRPQSGADGEELENGHFGRTATKLSLTLSKGGDDDVSSLRQMLKDCLKNGKEKSGKRAPAKAKEEVPALAADAANASAAPTALADTASVDATVAKAEDAKGQDASKETSGEQRGQGTSDADLCATVSLARGPASMSDSNPSSRDTSPGRAQTQALSRNGSPASRASPRRGSPTGNAAPSARVVGFVSRLSGELRQLVAMSQQTEEAGLVAMPDASPGASPRSAGPPPSRAARLLALLEAVGPARKTITQGIIAAERALRVLERDLRRHCEQLLGAPEPQLPAGTEPSDAAWLLAASKEAEGRVPITEEQQREGLAGLRQAQRRSGAALEELVRLPTSLKVVFDITKQLGSEINAGALQPSSPTGAGLPANGSAPARQEAASQDDEEAAVRETREELERGVPHEAQCVAARVAGHRLARALASREEARAALERELQAARAALQAQGTTGARAAGNAD